MRNTSLKASLIKYLNNRDGRPSYLHEIYAVLSTERGKPNDDIFKAQVRGILNASIKKNEGVFERVVNESGLYILCDRKEGTFDEYIEKVEKEQQLLKQQEQDEKISRQQAINIYKKHINFAYLEANKMHGSSCIVSLDELQSASQIALYKGACDFRPNKTKCDGGSPIPYLKKYVRGILLNTIREQKNWNSRNLRVTNPDVMGSLKVSSFEEIADEKENFTDDISISELRDILIQQMREHLNDDEFEVVSKRWGLDGKGGMTFKQIGKEITSTERKNGNDESAKSWSWQMERAARRKLCKNSKVLKVLFESYYA